ncbi:MAG: Gfo/Idh/MocA family oxidoreductase [candidate division WOR-3 bacterium]
MITIAVIGTGSWGRRHIRVFAEMPGCQVVALADTSAESLAHARPMAPEATCFQDHRDLLARCDCPAVVVATPAHTHYPITRDCLVAGRHVLVEKPLAVSVAEARKLCLLARQQHVILMVGHILLYHPALQQVQQLHSQGILGQLRRIRAWRTDPKAAPNGESALWAFAVHDIAVMNWLMARMPAAVCARRRGPGDQVHFRLRFDPCVEAQGLAAWQHPTRQRRLWFEFDRAEIVFDDLATPKLTIRSAPALPGLDSSTLCAEPLRLEADDFCACIRNRALPRSDGTSGLSVIQTAQALEQSLREDGSPVTITGDDP